MSTLKSARERARAEIRAEILAAALVHLAAEGPAGLSLRAVARDLDLVPSAVYRYFENRDALLTALIVQAYESLGATAEAAVDASAGRPPLERWVATAEAIRTWARDHPHEYTLLYGTPVPGYAAPSSTVDPGTRVTRALLEIVRTAAPLPSPPSTASAALRTDLTALVAELSPELDDAALLAAVVAWTQLFGLLSFELFGQTRGMTTHDADLFTAAVTATGRWMGLSTERRPALREL